MNKWENALHMDGYYMVGVTPILHPGYKCIITLVSKEEKTYLVSPLHIFRNALAWNLRKCCLCQWERGVSGFHVSTCITCSIIRARLTTPLANSFMHQHLATMRWCVFLRLQVLDNRLNGIGVKDMDTIIPHFYIYRNICVCPYEM